MNWDSKLIKPISPILSRSSLHKMPQSIGLHRPTSLRDLDSKSLKSHLGFLSARAVHIEEVEDTCRANLTESLCVFHTNVLCLPITHRFLSDLKFSIDAETHEGVTKLIHSIISASRDITKSSPSKQSDFNGFLRSESPVLHPIPPMTPPLFSRTRDRRGRMINDNQPQSLAECSKWMPIIPIEEREEDLAEENLTLISGWSTVYQLF